MNKILLLANTSWYIYNFRKSLIEALISNGFHVVCAAPVDNYTEKLKSLGAEYVNIEYDNSNKNPFRDSLFLFRLIKLFNRQTPSVVLSFTIKANIYGGIAARNSGIPIIANVSGLGSLIISGSALSRLPLLLYKFGLSKENKIFFQNKADLSLFKMNNVVSHQDIEVLPGSGVDLDWFSSTKAGSGHDKLIFLLAARLLKDKGIIESVEAVRKLKRRNKNIELQLLGQLWTKNPSQIKQHELDQWIEEGLVSYLGFTEDVRPYIENADVVLLPSYREGMARILLEAASMGKPIITTDVPGCREVVDDAQTGFLCRVRDPNDLAEKMIRMLELSDDDRALMGKRGRKKMEKEFSEKIVINRYLEAINKI